jgi:hypothetical protein
MKKCLFRRRLTKRVYQALYRFEERQNETNRRAHRAFFVISRTNEISKAIEVSQKVC